MLRWFPVCLVACSLGYGPPFDASRFSGAALDGEGSRCVFAWHHKVYRPATGIRAFPDGGIPRWEIDRRVVGVVDLGSGEVSVLHVADNERFQPGHGSFVISQVAGPYALVTWGGQLAGGDQAKIGFARLDLRDGMWAPVTPDRDLAAVGRELERVEITEDFAMVLVAGPDPQDVWVRDDNGLRRLARTDHYYGVQDGGIWWYDPDRRVGVRTDLRTGSEITDGSASFAMPRPEPDRVCRASADGVGVELGVRGPDGWTYTPLAIDPEVLRAGDGLLDR